MERVPRRAPWRVPGNVRPLSGDVHRDDRRSGPGPAGAVCPPGGGGLPRSNGAREHREAIPWRSGSWGPSARAVMDGAYRVPTESAGGAAGPVSSPGAGPTWPAAGAGPAGRRFSRPSAPGAPSGSPVNGAGAGPVRRAIVGPAGATSGPPSWAGRRPSVGHARAGGAATLRASQGPGSRRAAPDGSGRVPRWPRQVARCRSSNRRTGAESWPRRSAIR